MSLARRKLLPAPRPAAPGLRHVYISDDVWRHLVRYSLVSEGDARFASIVAERLLADAINERLPMAERMYAIRKGQERIG